MLNNKGQSLVLFLIVLPILMLFLILLIDIGKVILLKQELTNISNIALDYGLDNIGKAGLDRELENIIELNKNDIDTIEIRMEDNKIYVYLSEKHKGIFSGFVDISIFKVNTAYVGYIENDEKRIEKLGD